MMKSKKKMLAGVLGSMSILALFIASAYAEGVNEHYVEDHTISDGIRATIEHQDDPSNVLNYVSDSGKNITIGKGIYGYRIGNIHTESVNEINVRSGGEPHRQRSCRIDRSRELLHRVVHRE